jgi:hypothetical protein
LYWHALAHLGTRLTAYWHNTGTKLDNLAHIGTSMAHILAQYYFSRLRILPTPEIFQRRIPGISSEFMTRIEIFISTRKSIPAGLGNANTQGCCGEENAANAQRKPRRPGQRAKADIRHVPADRKKARQTSTRPASAGKKPVCGALC